MTIGADVAIEFTDVLPPAPFAVELTTGQVLGGERLDEICESIADRHYRFGWEHELDDSHRLQDGDIIHSVNGIYRLNLPSQDSQTLVAQLHLGLDDYRSLRINVGELWASFESAKSWFAPPENVFGFSLPMPSCVGMRAIPMAAGLRLRKPSALA